MQLKIMISYSHNDGETYAKKVESSLRESGINCWIDKNSIKYGSIWLREIDTALESHDYVLGIVTPSYLDSVGGLEAYAKLSSEIKKESFSFIPLFFMPISEIKSPLIKAIQGFNMINYNDTIKNLIEYLEKGQSMEVDKNTLFQFNSNVHLEKYLKYCVEIITNKNLKENYSIEESYIENTTILVNIKTWNWDTRMFNLEIEKKWDIDEFLQSNSKYVIIGSPFGVGKTWYSIKKTADLASRYLLDNVVNFLPIRIDLRTGTIDDEGTNLETFLPNVNQKSKILFIYDGLDEINDKHKLEVFFQQIHHRSLSYPNSKYIITTRLNAGYPEQLNIFNYVRLLPFSHTQVDEYFRKHKIPLTYSELSKTGLEYDEIIKPLMCWIITLGYIKNPNLFSNISQLNRTLIFVIIIHNIIFGKKIDELEEHKKHFYNEKRVLRKIAELKHIYGNDLTQSIIEQSVKESDLSYNVTFMEYFSLLISSYFKSNNLNKNYEKLIDFIHTSFIDYLLAEYYIECLLQHKAYKINIKVPNDLTISFFKDLLNIFKNHEKMDLLTYFFESFTSKTNISVVELRKTLFDVSKDIFNNKQVIHINKNEYPYLDDLLLPKGYWLDRWFSVLVLNRFEDKYRIISNDLFDLVSSTRHLLHEKYLSIENIDLSKSEINEGLPNFVLANANLNSSSLKGEFHGTNFSGADLSNSTIKVGTKFVGVDFSGADLSNLKQEKVTETSPFIIKFIDCIFFKSKLNNAILKETSFTLSKFIETDFSGANLVYSDISLTDIRNIILDKNTNTKDINLLAKGYNYEWERIRDNKNLIKVILEDMDPDNFDPKMKYKILEDNLDYKYI